jgi:SAM-dependent methyltransferase
MSRYGGYRDLPWLAAVYDYIPGYRNRPDRDFYVQYCCEAGGKIVELGCGTGRILIPAAAAGCLVTGIDRSEYMLARCREKLSQKTIEVQKRVHLIEASMTDFDLNDRFRLAIIPFHSFQHLITVDEQMACLKRINHHLIPDGRLVFDVFQVKFDLIINPEVTKETVYDNFTLPDGRQATYSGRIAALHRAEQYNDVELIFNITDSDGNTERMVQTFPMRYFFRYEMEHLLARSGFKVIEIYGNFDHTPLTDDSPEMIFVAGKN